MAQPSIFQEFLAFIKTQKRSWALPVIIIRVWLGRLVIFSQNSPTAQFDYKLF